MQSHGAIVEVIARFSGDIQSADGKAIHVDKPAPNATSVVYDAVIVPGGEKSVAELMNMGSAIHFLSEAFVHGKPIAVVEEAAGLLARARIPSTKSEKDGVIVGAAGADVDAVMESFIKAMKQHRFFERNVEMVPA